MRRLRRPLAEAVDDVVEDALLHQQARPLDADLAGRDERSEGGACGGHVRVGVLEDHDSGFAAQLGRHGNEVAPGCSRDGAAGLGATGDVDLGQQRMLDERLTGLGAVARSRR